MFREGKWSVVQEAVRVTHMLSILHHVKKNMHQLTLCLLCIQFIKSVLIPDCDGRPMDFR